MRFLVLFLVFIFLGLREICAQEIIVKGNTKTSSDYVKKLALDCLESEKGTSKEKRLDYLKQCLQNSKLFSEILIEENQRDEAPQIIITVKDRWSIIIFPFIQLKNDGKRSLGLFLLDSNFLGKGNILGLGGTSSTTSSGYSLFYRDKAVFMSKWSAGFSFSKSISEVSIKDKKENERNAYIERLFQYRINSSYSFNPHYILNQGIYGKKYSFHEFHGYEKPKKFNAYGASLDLSLVFDQFKFYYQEGIKFNVGIDREFIKRPKSSHPMIFWQYFSLGKGSFDDHVFQIILSSMKIFSGDARDKLKNSGKGQGKGGQAGLRGLPEGVLMTNFLAGTSFDYQIPFSHKNYGTWTYAPFIDFAYLNHYGIVNQNMMNLSYGVGGYLFLKGIIIPGLGLVTGYNQIFKKVFFEFSLGSSF